MTEDAFWHCLTWPHVIRFKDFARLEDFALPKKGRIGGDALGKFMTCNRGEVQQAYS